MAHQPQHNLDEEISRTFSHNFFCEFCYSSVWLYFVLIEFNVIVCGENDRPGRMVVNINFLHLFMSPHLMHTSSTCDSCQWRGIHTILFREFSFRLHSQKGNKIDRNALCIMLHLQWTQKRINCSIASKIRCEYTTAEMHRDCDEQKIRIQMKHLFGCEYSKSQKQSITLGGFKKDAHKSFCFGYFLILDVKNDQSTLFCEPLLINYWNSS